MYQVQVVLKKQICSLIFHEDTMCGVVTPLISNLYFRRSESSASSSGRFTEAKGHPVAILIKGGWIRPRDCLKYDGKQESL